MLKSGNGIICVLCTLFGFSWVATAKQELSFATIGTLHMRSFNLDLYTDKKKAEEIKDIAQAIVAIRLNEEDKRRLAYQICIRQEQNNFVEDDINLKNLVEDLDIFYGHGQNAQDTIFNKLFAGNLRSCMGEVMVAKRLAQPVTDMQQLRDYQECISAFANDQELLKKTDLLLARISKSEANMLLFWQEEHPVVKKMIERLYFGKRLSSLNKNANVLEASMYLGSFLSIVSTVDIPCAMTFPAYFMAKIVACMARKMGAAEGDIKQISFKESVRDALNNCFNPVPVLKDLKHQYTDQGHQERAVKIDAFIHDVEKSVLKQLDEARDAKQVEDCNKTLELIKGQDRDKLNSTMRNISVAKDLGSLIFKSYVSLRLVFQAKAFVTDVIQKRDMINFLQSTLIDVAEYVRSVKELHKLAQANPCLNKFFPISQVYEKLFHSDIDEVRQLVDLLMTNTFTGKASFFSRSGRILVAYELMNKVKEEFVECMQLLGNVDAIVAISKLYTSFKNERVGYTFAEYVSSHKPYIQAEGFWNPLVDSSTVVTNNMLLGQEGKERNIILTGSNKGGKSTLLKAAMLDALLAQTITIVPAKRYIITPFACLATYLNVTDDTAAGLSLFQAQVARAKKLVEMIDTLSANKLGFVIIDEIFTGTGSEKAASAAYKVAEHMAQMDSLCFILATHFIDEMAVLEPNTEGLCKNFKVDADKDVNGNIIFKYKLEEGISTQNIANEILNDEFENIDFCSDKAVVA